MESSGERWYGGADEVVVVVVGRCVCKREAGEGAGAKNSKPSRSGSVSGCIGAAEG